VSHKSNGDERKKKPPGGDARAAESRKFALLIELPEREKQRQHGGTGSTRLSQKGSPRIKKATMSFDYGGDSR